MFISGVEAFYQLTARPGVEDLRLFRLCGGLRRPPDLVRRRGFFGLARWSHVLEVVLPPVAQHALHPIYGRAVRADIRPRERAREAVHQGVVVGCGRCHGRGATRFACAAAGLHGLLVYITTYL